ncbi:MAG: hypothetical protein RR314_06845 [Oscillospiraceae bacterium]
MSKSRFSKRLIALLIVVVLVAAVMPTAALADWDVDSFNRPVVTSTVEEHVSHVAYIILDRMVALANARIASLVRFAQATPYNDVNWLLRQVDYTVAPVFAFAKLVGATVVCEYVPYVVDGQTVLIDPLRVVRS